MVMHYIQGTFKPPNPYIYHCKSTEKGHRDAPRNKIGHTGSSAHYSTVGKYEHFLAGTLLTNSLQAAHPFGSIHAPILGSPFCDQLLSLNPREVVEVRGSSSSGKTHLLYLLLINCMVPHKYEDATPRGWGKVGIIFDMDGDFSVIRLHQLLIGHLTHILPSNKDIAKLIAQESLKRLHIFRPTSSIQLSATITHLAKYHTINSLETEIGLVAIDSMSAHYWSDRFTAEQMQSPTEHGKRGPQFISPLQHVLAALEVFRQSHGNVTVLTNWDLHPIANSTTPVNYKHLYPLRSHLLSSHTVSSQLTNSSYLGNLSITCHITLSVAPSSLSHQETSNEEFTALVTTSEHSKKFTFRIASNIIYV